MASFFRTTSPLNVTMSPSLSASMEREVTTMGSRFPFSRENGAGDAATRAAASRASASRPLFLQHGLDIAVHHHVLEVHIGGHAGPLDIDLFPQHLEGVRGPDHAV